MSRNSVLRVVVQSLIVCSLFVLACDSDVTLLDRTAPGDVIDLAGAPRGHGAVVLFWTAPGDDAYKGTAEEYDIRLWRSCDADSESWDKQCKPFMAPVPAPSAAGRPESLLIEGLAPASEYCFVMRTIDDKRYYSGWSNVMACSTGFSREEVTEGNDAEVIAIDVSGESEPPPALVDSIQRDLDAIRAGHPFYWTIHARKDGKFHDITSDSPGSYTFFYLWGDCYAGCAHGHYWTLTVMDGEVSLVDEGGDPLPCAPWGQAW